MATLRCELFWLQSILYSQASCITHTIFAPDPSSLSLISNIYSGTRFPIAHYVNCTNFSPKHRSLLAAITASHEPGSFREAASDPRWRTTMQAEIQALENNNT
ncbi:unnamed protein product [Cuscuta epithymum]|uniref:Uncharacterized protein n=1 Tax=Cuscuta epithymum TaxID=186058 RepID=A0AAV0GD54_9ASTE|nr:unnamed protein product [Cuscuta epithymum]